jgi:dolichyl-phosphate beta-glucosyltransferase
MSHVSRHIQPILINPTTIPVGKSSTPSMNQQEQQQQQQQQQQQRPLLSIIIPAYDEEIRLPTMLSEAYQYLSESNCIALKNLDESCRIGSSLSGRIQSEEQDNNMMNESQKLRTVSSLCSIEWIVVNDGSKDRTNDAYQQYIQSTVSESLSSSSSSSAISTNPQHNHHPNPQQQQPPQQHIWKLISFPSNQGKGAAVQAGMLAATGHYCLMVDADGATEFQQGLEQMATTLLAQMKLQQQQQQQQQQQSKKQGVSSYQYPVLFGSRAHLRDQKDGNVSMGRQLIRTIISEGFRYCAIITVGASDIRDTQCGFKLFPSIVAQHIFTILHLRRWAFDTEIVYLCHHLHYPIMEIPVPWHEVEGSKLHTSAINLALVSIGMLRDMICVRLCYTFGIWKMKKKQL